MPSNQSLNINPLVADLTEMCEAVQMVQCMLKQTNYVTTGEVFMMMSDETLAELLTIIDGVVTTGERDAYKQLVILVLLLSKGEGNDQVHERDLYQMIGRLSLLASFEAKHRMGTCEINHDRMSVVDPHPIMQMPI